MKLFTDFEVTARIRDLYEKHVCLNSKFAWISPAIKDAILGANNPSGTNTFVTEEDIADFITADDLPAPLDPNITDALSGANLPSALNPYATISDIAAIPDPITVVANYAALPAAATVTGEFYWAESSQGTQWLPGSLGGTYYPLGIYYSNGVSWSHIETPYQATQLEVNAGSNDTKFVTPLTGQVAYAFKPGIAGGQTLIGGTGVTDALTLQGTSGNGTLTDKALRVLVGNNGATEAMTVLNNGNVGIGTTSPLYKLHIEGNGDIRQRIRNLNAFGYTVLEFGNDTPGVGGISGGFFLNGSAAALYGGVNSINLININNAPLSLGTNNLVRLLIGSNGNLSLTPASLTGSSATSALSITQTWNTTGSPTAIFANITNTASGANSLLMDIQFGSISVMRLSKIGYLDFLCSVSSQGGISFGNNTDKGVFCKSGSTSTTIYSQYTGHDFRVFDGSSYAQRAFLNHTGLVLGTGSINARASLDIQSTTQGFLPPRMTTAQRDAIATVAGDAGLTIFNTTTTKLEVWDGTAWQQAW